MSKKWYEMQETQELIKDIKIMVEDFARDDVIHTPEGKKDVSDDMRYGFSLAEKIVSRLITEQANETTFTIT